MTDTDKLAQVLAEHDIYSMPRNLGQYRSAYACACGEDVITDVHRGINRPAAFAAHVAAVVLAHLTAEGWAQGREEWGYGATGGYDGTYVRPTSNEAEARDRAQINDCGVFRRRVTDWEPVEGEQP